MFFIIVKESPIACVPVAQAVTGELFGPLRLYLIEICPDSKLIKEDGIKKGEFPKTKPQVLFKALGGLFMGLVLMGKDKPVSKKDIEKLLNDLIPNTSL